MDSDCLENIMKTCGTELYNPFVVPFLKVKVSNWKVKKQKLLEMAPLYSDDTDPINGGYKSDYFKYAGLPPYFRSFHEVLSDELNEIGNYFKDVNILNLWTQEYVVDEFHDPHNHGGYFYSAVLYAEFDPSEHEPTHFISPINNFEDGTVIRHRPNIEEGDIIIFPSVIQHFSGVSKSSKTRKIFSFNFRAAALF